LIRPERRVLEKEKFGEGRDDRKFNLCRRGCSFRVQREDWSDTDLRESKESRNDSGKRRGETTNIVYWDGGDNFNGSKP